MIREDLSDADCTACTANLRRMQEQGAVHRLPNGRTGTVCMCPWPGCDQPGVEGWSSCSAHFDHVQTAYSRSPEARARQAELDAARNPAPAVAIRLEDAKEGDVAFWRYDHFPYVLGGVIGGLPSGWADRPMVDVDRGVVFVGSYQSNFTARLILNAEDGAAMLAELKRLEALNRRVWSEVHTQMATARTAALARFPIADSTL